MALQLCAAEVCNENHVEENETSAKMCNKIPVPSLFGGAGRTTLFGRILWCAAMLSTGPVLDLYSGIGDSTALLVNGLAQRGTVDGRRLVSFERSFERLSFVAARLRNQAAVHTIDAQTLQQSNWQKQFWPKLSSQVSALLISGSTTDCLDLVSKHLGEPGLLLLDPDVEVPQEEFARDWRTLERLNPRIVAGWKFIY